MAPRATEADTEESRPGGGHHVIEPVELLIVRVRVILQPRPQLNELPQLLVLWVRHKMKTYEFIKRHILIERTNHRIPETPRIGPRFIVVHREMSCALTEAHDIEPMPTPAFTKARAGQQAVDESLVGLGFLIGKEPLNFLHGRRQAGEIKRHAPNQSIAICLRLGL